MRKVLLAEDQVKTLIQLLQKSKDARSTGMIETLRSCSRDSLLLAWCQELAEEKHLHQEGDVEVDKDTVISLSEGDLGVQGAYVMAWTYVDLSPEDKRRFRIPLDKYEKLELRDIRRAKKREEVTSDR